MMCFHRTFVHLNYPTNVDYEAPVEQGGLISLFTGFKWNPRSSRSGSIVEEVRNPTGSLMEMILSEILDSQDQNTVGIAWATAEHFARLSL